MSESDLVRKLQIGQNALDALGIYWDRSKAERAPKDARFLSDQLLVEASTYLNLSTDIEKRVLECAARVRTSPTLVSFAWYCRWCLLRAARGHTMEEALDRLPAINDLSRVLGDLAAVFYVMVLLSSLSSLLKRMKYVYRRHGIGSRVVRRTLQDVAVELEDYRVEHGRWGMEPRLLNWFRLHFSGNLYRIGRFNFELGHYGQSAYAMRHRKTSVVLLVAKDGVLFDSRGQLASPWSNAGASEIHPGRWSSRLSVTRDQIVGNPIWPEGYADGKSITLRTRDWQQILSPGDPVLHLHVPTGGRLDFDPIGRNLRKALDFFHRHFPRHPVRAIDCVSWFLDRQLQELLSSDSNIVRFQREVYLVPSLSGNDDLLRAVFGSGGIGNAPHLTRLQRELARRLGEGEPMSALGGGCVLFERDLAWGGGSYLSQDFELAGLSRRQSE